MRRLVLRKLRAVGGILVRFLQYFRRRLCQAIMNLQDFRAKMTMVYLGHLSNVILCVALGMGLYTSWRNTNNTTLVAFSVLGLCVFCVSCALQLYFNMETVGQAVLHVWLGCTLGVVVFEDSREFQYDTMEEVMNVLLITSAGFGIFWSTCERCMHITKHEPHLFSMKEGLESVGFMCATLVTGEDSIAISLCTVAFVLNLTAIRLKSLLGLISLIVLFITVSLVILRGQSFNMYGLLCFAGRHCFEPLIDLYFSGLSTLERWQAFFNKSGFVRKLVILMIFIINIVLGAMIGRLSANHKEWFVVVPLYAFFAVLWLCFHVIYFISAWKLMNKITDCNLTLNSISDDRLSMNRIMSSKGIRHFSLISQRLMCLTLLTTLVLMAVGWETRTNYSIALVMVVLPIEGVTLSLFWELGDNLGGTCIGYALIAPHTGLRSGGGAKLLSAATVQDIGSRATSTLNKVQQFFNFNMIENYGCDFSSSGITEEYLKSKVMQFFDRKTQDGPRYDTYLLYYSGDVHDSGDWGLADNGSLKLDTLLEWWSDRDSNSGSRFILVLDTQHSWRWAQEVAKISDEFVAVQTCKFTRAPDPEAGEKLSIGAFTEDWVQFNISGEIDPSWSDKSRLIRAVYKVSQPWTDFTFHLPTREDIAEHWNSNFPKFTKPLIKAVNFLGTGSLCCCCDGVRKCVKRKRMHWLPAKASDTGHGFKLVRS